MTIAYDDTYFREFLDFLGRSISEEDANDIEDFFYNELGNFASDCIFVGSTDWSDDQWYSRECCDFSRALRAYIYSFDDVFEKVKIKIEKYCKIQVDTNHVKELICDEFGEANWFIYIEDSYNSWIQFFDNWDEAYDVFITLENSEKPYVEDYLYEFEKMVDERVAYSFVDARYNGVHNDFQVYMDEMLIIDNARKLEEDEADEFASFVNFKNEIEEEYGIYITDCQKYKHDVGFTRGYTITFEKDGASVEKDIELTGYNSLLFAQGNKRNIKNIIEKTIDIEDLLEELEGESESE